MYYDKKSKSNGYSDLDYENDEKTRRSTSG